MLSQKVLFVYAVTFSFFRYGCLSHTPAFHNPEILEYTKVGDYYLPNLYYPEETRPIGLWGMLRKEYLKEHKSGTYTYLLLTGRLDSYLADLNEQAQERFDLIEAQMRSAEGVTEELKRQNPMEWVRHCNNIRNRAAEIIKQELIYV